jgi:aldose 1-epimerase
VGTAAVRPSGEQFEIVAGSQRATVTEVGATLRSYIVDGIAVLDGFEESEPSNAGRGQILAPWPNRLEDGRYSFEGIDGRAALDEPERGNAIHGLVRWLPWRVTSRSASAVALGCVLHPQPAYPWRLELSVEYSIDDEGLTVAAAASSGSDTTAPFGIGFHPYLTLGTATIDDVHVTIPAHTRLEADERGLPTGEVDVDGDFDFRAAKRVGPIELDTGYTDLIRSEDGRARVEVDLAGGDRGLTLWADEAFGYLMIYTGHSLEPESRRRQGLAVEPMTCPPNAFRSGSSIARLAPGDGWSGSWGIHPARLTGARTDLLVSS